MQQVTRSAGARGWTNGGKLARVPGNSHSRGILPLLAIPHAPPRCIAHWARSASVPPRFHPLDSRSFPLLRKVGIRYSSAAMKGCIERPRTCCFFLFFGLGGPNPNPAKFCDMSDPFRLVSSSGNKKSPMHRISDAQGKFFKQPRSDVGSRGDAPWQDHKGGSPYRSPSALTSSPARRR